MTTRYRRTARLATAIAALGASAAFLPGSAGATDYCVGGPAGCSGTDLGNDFKKALDLADDAPNADRIFLGPMNFMAPSAAGFAYLRQDAPVEIIGSGPNLTVVMAPIGSQGRTLEVFGGPGTRIRNLRVHLRANAQDVSTGIHTSATVSGVTVSEDPTQSNFRVGIALAGGRLEGSTVSLGAKASGVILDDGPGTTSVADSSISADSAILSAHGGVVERTELTGRSSGIWASRSLTTLRSSTIEVEASGKGIVVEPADGTDATLIADGVNLIGQSGAAAGIVATTSFAGDGDGRVVLRNSILRGFERPLGAYSGNGTGRGSVSAEYSDYDASDNATGGTGTITESHISNVGAAAFVSPGDFHLAPGSPLIDAGAPSTAQGLDLERRALVTDGNGDGVARRDIGALEHPAVGGSSSGGGSTGGGSGSGSLDTVAPVVSGFAIARRTLTPTRRNRFRYTLSEPASVTITIQRRLSGGRTRIAARLSRSGLAGSNRLRFSTRIGRRTLRPGRYRAVIRAADAAGNRSAAGSLRFRVVRG